MLRLEAASLFPEFEEKPREYCAVFGVTSFTGRDVAHEAVLGLYAQQNRGQGGTGIATFNSYGGDFKHYRGKGLVSDVFPKDSIEDYGLNGNTVIGHNRYSTSGSKEKSNHKDEVRCLQPYVVSYKGRSIAIAHNGNIPQANLEELKEGLPLEVPYESDTDSEVLAWRIIHAQGSSWKEKIARGLSGVKGAYSLVVATDEGDLFGIKDPLGVRPLAFAKTFDGAAIASETQGFEHLKGVHDVGEIKNGEMVHIKPNGEVEFSRVFPETKPARCVVESLYFKHPNSMEGQYEVSEVRYRSGQEAAREFPLPSDYMFIGIPDSGQDFMCGYAEALGAIARNTAIRKDRYRGGIRSFIEDTPAARDATLELKFTVSRAVRDKIVVLGDDSLIRGKTTEKLIAKVRAKGAKEVHVVLGSPKFVETCDLGVDIASHNELKALKNGGGIPGIKTDQQIADEIGADSVHFLSLEGLKKAIGGEADEFCANCMTRSHPIRRLGSLAGEIYTPIDLVEGEELTLRKLSA